MSELIERMADAMCEATENCRFILEGMTVEDLARVALQAAREPTTAMEVEGGMSWVDSRSGGDGRMAARLIFQRMIDAELADG